MQLRPSAIEVACRVAFSVRRKGCSALDVLPLRLCFVSNAGCETLNNGIVCGVQLITEPWRSTIAWCELKCTESMVLKGLFLIL